jgi:phage terminase small subunit
MNNQEKHDRQERFVIEYLKTGVAYKAALNAGYTEKYARTHSHQLIGQPKIKKLMDRLLKKMALPKIADAEEVLEQITSIGRGEMIVEEKIVSRDGSIIAVEQEPNHAIRLEAYKTMGKRYGLWSDKVDVSITVPVIFQGDDEV